MHPQNVCKDLKLSDRIHISIEQLILINKKNRKSKYVCKYMGTYLDKYYYLGPILIRNAFQYISYLSYSRKHKHFHMAQKYQKPFASQNLLTISDYHEFSISGV